MLRLDLYQDFFLSLFFTLHVLMITSAGLIQNDFFFFFVICLLMNIVSLSVFDVHVKTLFSNTCLFGVM